MRSIKITKYLYTGSLFFLIILTAACVALSAADVIIQSLTDKTSNGKFDFRNLIVVSGSYVLLVSKEAVIYRYTYTLNRQYQQFYFLAVDY